MNYKLRLNEDPSLEAPVNHFENIDDSQIKITDAGKFFIKEPTVLEKIELIGDDGEVYALRKLPPHLTYTLTSSSSIEMQFNLFLSKHQNKSDSK